MSWAFRFCLEVYFFLLPRAIGPPCEPFDKTNASRRRLGFDYFARLHAARCENARPVKNTSCPPRTQRRHQLYQGEWRQATGGVIETVTSLFNGITSLRGRRYV